jgi:3-methylcrotonyl-CoA carboxylase alpha subunit
MPGKIVRILVQAGAQVEKGQPLLVMEAMKMENEIRAAGAGKVSAVKVIEGQAVETGADLMLIE